MTSPTAGTHADSIEDLLRTVRSGTSGDLAAVAHAVVIAEHADALVVQVVRQAHLGGHGWGQIAAVLGTSAAHARQRSAHAEVSSSPPDADQAALVLTHLASSPWR